MSILNSIYNSVREAVGAVPKNQNNFAYDNLNKYYPTDLAKVAQDIGLTSPAPAPAPTQSSDGGGYSSGGGSYQAAADPYAKYGGQAAYNSLVSGYDTQKNNVLNTAGDAVSNSSIGLNSSILDLIDSTRAGQNKLDRQGVQNELARKVGAQGVMGMVDRGIKSSGVLLSNKNAGDSSAAGAFGRAYGDIGRRELSNVGNQFAKAQNDVALGQEDLGVQTASGVRKINESKNQIINNIVADARGQLAALDGQIANASLPNRINIEGLKEQIRSNAITALQGLDQKLAGVGDIKAQDEKTRIAKANELAAAGAAPDTAFQFNDQAPTALQNTGPFASNLPIFTVNKKQEQQTA